MTNEPIACLTWILALPASNPGKKRRKAAGRREPVLSGGGEKQLPWGRLSPTGTAPPLPILGLGSPYDADTAEKLIDRLEARVVDMTARAQAQRDVAEAARAYIDSADQVFH
jgi:hypothetical protein